MSFDFSMEMLNCDIFVFQLKALPEKDLPFINPK